jgi:hypothetical protein
MTRAIQNSPNLLIIGPPKSGTTFLFQMLRMHPDICASKIKETRYFSPILKRETIKSFDKYLKYFKHYNEEKVIMEATPGYFYGGKNMAIKVNEILGEIKIIIVLREPVARLFSSYKHKKRFNNISDNETFLEFSKNKNNFGKQLYHDYLSGWIDIFGDRIKVLFFEDIIHKPVETSLSVFSWLEIEQIKINANKLANSNKSMSIRSRLIHKAALPIFKITRPMIPFELRTMIRKVYFEFNGKPNKWYLKDRDAEYLHKLFVVENQKTRDILTSNVNKDLPKWLNRDQAIEY